tara:strand:- start:39 stop:521 length:483 start_codon:yes stop_codon:yes gene_type:complete
MGFDDSWYDEEVLAQLIIIIEENKDTFTYYCEGLGDKDIVKVKEFLKLCEEEKCYNGYSTAFHMLFGAIRCVWMGACPFGNVNEDRLKVFIRGHLLDMDIYKDLMDKNVLREITIEKLRELKIELEKMKKKEREDKQLSVGNIKSKGTNDKTTSVANVKR